MFSKLSIEITVRPCPLMMFGGLVHNKRRRRRRVFKKQLLSESYQNVFLISSFQLGSIAIKHCM
jgi:hypothetical protein